MNQGEIKRTYLARVDALLAKLRDVDSIVESSDRSTVDACFLGAVGVVEALYGGSSPQARALLDSRRAYTKTASSPAYELRSLGNSVKGTLLNIREELEADLVRSIATEAAGEIFGDLVALAKAQLKAGFTSVAAVLASAAFEDALKRKAQELGVNVEGKTLDAIVNALKAKSFFKGAQAPIVSSYVKLRNASMHADWEAIGDADVSSLIGFLEPFLLEHFS